jgi:hypothetical protein
VGQTHCLLPLTFGHVRPYSVQSREAPFGRVYIYSLSFTILRRVYPYLPLGPHLVANPLKGDLLRLPTRGIDLLIQSNPLLTPRTIPPDLRVPGSALLIYIRYEKRRDLVYRARESSRKTSARSRR